MVEDELKPADLDEIDWTGILYDVDQKRVERYRSRFFDEAQQREESGQKAEARAYRFLGDICSMHMRKDDISNPFGPMFRGPNGRTAMIDDFSDNELEAMSQIQTEIEEPELKARVNDVLWTSERDHEAAEEAFEAYLESAEILFDPSSWSTSFERIERAFQIASMLNNKELMEEGRDTAIDWLDRLDGEDPKYLTFNLLQLLKEHNLGEFDDLSRRTEEAATKAEDESNWRKAKKLWLLKSEFDRELDDMDAAQAAEVKAGEAQVTEAEEMEERSNLAASDHYKTAVEIFRRAGETERAKEIQERLLETQEKGVDEMEVFEHGVDLSEGVESARNAVSELSKLEALRKFAIITSPPQKEELQQSAEDKLEDESLRAVMPKTIVDDDGKTVAKQDSIIASDEDQQVLRAEAMGAMVTHFGIQVNGIIAPARAQLLKDHRITKDDLTRLVRYNPFVPPGHEGLYIQGLYRGFAGDFISACHILIPQIEHSLRYLMSQSGTITSSLQSDGIQEEYSLNTLLEMDELEELLGEDLVFTLDGLFNSKHGANFRHRTAHGLLEGGHFGSETAIYTWWLALHILFLPTIKPNDGQEQGDTSQTETSN